MRGVAWVVAAAADLSVVGVPDLTADVRVLMHLDASGPRSSGGRAERRGQESVVTDRGFDATISQEVGHNLDLDHCEAEIVQDSPRIYTAGANWNDGSCRYAGESGDLANRYSDGPDHDNIGRIDECATEGCWVEPSPD